MKKAYVKPVFFAEEFVAETSYAAGPCVGASVNEKQILVKGKTSLCEKHGYDSCNSTTVGKTTEHIDAFFGTDSNMAADQVSTTTTYWQYATSGSTDDQKNAYLFNSNLFECDFLWNGPSDNKVGFWGTTDYSQRSKDNVFFTKFGLSQFFSGNSSDGGHELGYNGATFFS